ncbi:MAG: GNAT family N-acetyltransferase [Lachnospiraceae bacterium]|nr:GNAT family N-acetyltransferase [Lachnospiraceae bacterium]
MQDNLKVEIINYSDEIDHACLDALIHDSNVQHETKYLQIMSQNIASDFEGFFAIAKKDDAMVAWTYFFIDRQFSCHGLLSGFAEKLYNIFPFQFRAAFISSPVAEYNMFHIDAAYRGQEDYLAEEMVEQILLFLKKKHIKLVIVKDHISNYASTYFHKKFSHVHIMPGTYIELSKVSGCPHYCKKERKDDCTCFDAYLMGLKRNWRANVRNKMNRRKEDLFIEVVSGDSLSIAENQRCYDLYCQTRNKQKIKHELLTSNYFYQCGMELGDKCKMLIARVDGKIIGFAQLLENEHDVINVRIGMDYECNREYNLYYHLLYENIIYCLQQKKRRLYTSQTYYRPKLEIGAKLLPLHTYFYFYNIIIRKIFKTFIIKECACYSELLHSDDPKAVLMKHNLK